MYQPNSCVSTRAGNQNSIPQQDASWTQAHFLIAVSLLCGRWFLLYRYHCPRSPHRHRVWRFLVQTPMWPRNTLSTMGVCGFQSN